MDVTQYSVYAVRLRGDAYHAGAVEYEGFARSARSWDRRTVEGIQLAVGQCLVNLAECLGSIEDEVGKAEQTDPGAAVVVEAINAVLNAEGSLEVGVAGDDEID